MENLTNQDYSPLQYQIRWNQKSVVSRILHQDATCRAKHGSNLIASARDTAGLTQASTEWDCLIIKTVCAVTSNPPFTSSITVLLWPFHAVSPTPPTKIWSNIFVILPFRLNRIVLPPVNYVYTTEEEGQSASIIIAFEFFGIFVSTRTPNVFNFAILARQSWCAGA